MRLSASCVDTLMSHVNACLYHKTPYHWRSQLTTLETKARAFQNRRSIATVKRDDGKLRDCNLITKQFRKGNSNVNGRQWKSSITHPTWYAVRWLVLTKKMPAKVLRLWRELCGRIQKKGPPKLRDEPTPESPSFGIANSVKKVIPELFMRDAALF